MIFLADDEVTTDHWRGRTKASVRQQYQRQGFIPIMVTSHTESLGQAEQERMTAYAGQLSGIPGSNIVVVIERSNGYTMFGAATEVNDATAFRDYVLSFTPETRA